MVADQLLGLLAATEFVHKTYLLIWLVALTLHWDCLCLLAIYTARCSIATAAMSTEADLWLRVKLNTL
ncbi:hypothetical protein ASPFODRAFT_52361 [Aspergillus luchuensis CBS 106.47]|uniref:Uncharacterized protein n=1 Tax=Aspergillus luchuensis (strain CBS 106.47) TaxID=1137211 RepID=A0A1M3T3M6_ASPLC|nr:hypothetical protein ASPFODRAFT_52361 [Aspergillus luchuensis CBS 106.47]